MGSQVFLSYAHEDLDKVKKVYHGLIERRVDVWFDQISLQPGQVWYDEIVKAIPQCRIFVFCLSTAALKKIGDKPGFQDEELMLAFKIAMKQSSRNFSLVPVRLEDCGRGDNRLSMFHQHDLFPDFETALDKLSIILGGKSLSDSEIRDERTEDERTVDRLLGRAQFALLAEEHNVAILYYMKALTIIEAKLSNNYPNVQTIFDTLAMLCNMTGKIFTYRGVGKYELHPLPANLQNNAIKNGDLKPSGASTWEKKAFTYMEQGRFEEAMGAFDKALESEPSHISSWINKGALCAKQGRYEEALAALDKAVELAPNNAEAWMNRGGVLNYLKRFQDANESFDRSIELKPKNFMVWHNKGNALSQLGRYEAAIAAYDMSLELNPRNPNALHSKAQVLDLLGRYREAQMVLEKAKKLTQR